MFLNTLCACRDVISQVSENLKINIHNASLILLTVIALVQLRAGCLPIEIELGRYLHIPRNERLCKQCSMGTVESEKHFLFHCTKYHVLRQDFTRAISGVCPPNSNDDKLLNIFSSKALTLKTAHFICDALKLRIS